MLASYTLEELMIEYLEYEIEIDPSQAYSPSMLQGDVIPTGDAEVDQWQKDMAAGRDIDFTANMSPEDRALVTKWSASKKAAPDPQEFADDYSKDKP